MALVCLGGIGLFALSIIGFATDSESTTTDRIVGIALSSATIVLLAWLGYLGIRMAFSATPTLSLDADELTITHRALFRRPISIPRSAIAAVTVDVGTEEGFRPRDRFRILRSEDPAHSTVPDWLYSRKHGSPLPVIGHFRETPNVAVTLKEPIKFRGIRRVSRPLFRHTVRSPIRTKDVRGFLVAARHPFMAEQQFRAWGAEIRPVTTDDAVSLMPGPEDRRRQHWRTAISLGVGLILLGGQAYLFYLLADDDPAANCLSAATRAGAGFSVSGDQEGLLEPEELQEAIIDAPAGYIPEGANGDFDTPNGVIEARGYDGRYWEEALAQHDFVGGYARTMSGGSISLSAQILQTEEVADAVGLHAWAVGHQCQYAHDAYVIRSVPGALALRYELDDGSRGYEAFFVRGRRLYTIAVSERASTPSRTEFESIVESAAQVAR